MTASADHLENRRPGAVDDIYSLLCVAHMFVFDTLPWLEFVHKYHEKHNVTNVTEKRKILLKLRRKHKDAFDEKLCRNSKELNKFFMYVCAVRKARNQIDR